MKGIVDYVVDLIAVVQLPRHEALQPPAIAPYQLAQSTLVAVGHACDEVLIGR